jgi:hypothetical protein
VTIKESSPPFSAYKESVLAGHSPTSGPNDNRFLWHNVLDDLRLKFVLFQKSCKDLLGLI